MDNKRDILNTIRNDLRMANAPNTSALQFSAPFLSMPIVEHQDRIAMGLPIHVSDLEGSVRKSCKKIGYSLTFEDDKHRLSNENEKYHVILNNSEVSIRY